MDSRLALFKRALFSTMLITAGLFSFQFIASPKASAAVALNPDPGVAIIHGQRELLRNCDTLFNTSPAYAYFFTQPGTSNVDLGSFQVGPTTPNVSIRMNWASAVCRPNSAVEVTTLQSIPTTPGVTGLAPGFAHDYTTNGGPGNYNSPGTFRHTFSEFTYAPPGGFTTSGVYTVNIDLYRISRFRSGTLLCVNPGSRAPGNLLDFSACNKLTLTASFWVTVAPGAPTVDPIDTCTGISLSTNGSRVDVYGPGGGIGSVPGPSGELTLEGRVSPGTTLDVYGIGDGVTTSGNTHRRHTWNIPSTCRRDFTISPTASVTLTTKEEPTLASFSSSIALTTGPPTVKIESVRHRYYLVRAGVEVQIDDVARTQPLTAAGDRHARPDIDLRSYGLRAGDQVCSEVTVRPARGTASVGTGDVTSISQAEATDKRCTTIVNMPFVSFYGGDVSVGGDFINRPNCNTGVSSINTHMNARNLGSGVEFAAFVTGDIDGFRTAKVSPDPLIKRLAFANTGANFGDFGAVACVRDYFSDAERLLAPNTASSPTINLAAATSGNFLYRPSSGPVRLRGNIADGVRVGIYVKGDLIIDDNTAYQNTNWPSTQAIPSVHIYVSGNIYINRTVDNIVGMLVAQPDPARPNTGRIITCANNTSAVAGGQLFADCGTKLTVRGALVANHIDFLRGFGSLREATPDGERAASTSQGAEVVNLAPELLMVAPDSIDTARTKKYQYFTTLPPIL